MVLLCYPLTKISWFIKNLYGILTYGISGKNAGAYLNWKEVSLVKQKIISIMMICMWLVISLYVTYHATHIFETHGHCSCHICQLEDNQQHLLVICPVILYAVIMTYVGFVCQIYQCLFTRRTLITEKVRMDD